MQSVQEISHKRGQGRRSTRGHDRATDVPGSSQEPALGPSIPTEQPLTITTVNLIYYLAKNLRPP